MVVSKPDIYICSPPAFVEGCGEGLGWEFVRAMGMEEGTGVWKGRDGVGGMEDIGWGRGDGGGRGGFKKMGGWRRESGGEGMEEEGGKK